jgi:glycosyltransferase involved in cell wall biosynthesis
MRMGHDVCVLASNLRWPLGPYAALKRNTESREMKLGRAVEGGVPSVRLRVMAAPLGRLVLSGLERELLRFRPDVVHAHGYLLPTTLAVAFARAHTALLGRQTFRILVDEHQLPYQAVPGRLHRLERRALARLARVLLLPFVDELVAVAEGARQWLIEEYLCPPDRIEFIPLGADTDVFRPDEALRARMRVELKIGVHEALVLSTGKIAPHKRLDLLVQAAGAIPPERRPTLLFVGSSVAATRQLLTQLAASLDVKLRVLDAVAPGLLPGYFNAADLCVWPADCTISHLEAASCGRAIIIPAEQGIKDRIEQGNGIAVATGDVPALVSAIDGLLLNPSKRIALGEQGRRAVLERYSWRSIALRFENLYLRRRGTAGEVRN